MSRSTLLSAATDPIARTWTRRILCRRVAVSRRWPAARADREAPHVGIGMLGYAASMGKAHSNAFKKIP